MCERCARLLARVDEELAQWIGPMHKSRLSVAAMRAARCECEGAMFAMEAISEQRLALVHPVLAGKVRAAAEVLSAALTYFRVAQGLRTYAEQDALYAQGRTAPGVVVTRARAGFSNHNFGCAVDCYPFVQGQDGALDWDQNSAQFRVMVEALQDQGLVWGGTWVSMPDAPHFQLADVPVTPTEEDRAAFAQGGLKAVWALYPGLAV
jgi:hypothetical protein